MPETDGHSIEDVNCAQCGYLLRGRTAGDNCPECGLPGDESFRPDLLQYADPKWLRRLASGCRITAIGLGGLVIASAANHVVLMAELWSGDYPGFRIPAVIKNPVYLVMEVIILIGICRLSEAESVSLERPGLRRCRLWACRLFVAGLVVDILDWPIWALLRPARDSDAWLANGFLRYGEEAVFIAGDLLIIGGLLLGLSYLGGLAARLPNRRRRRGLAIIKWGLVITICLARAEDVLIRDVIFQYEDWGSAGGIMFLISFAVVAWAAYITFLAMATWLAVTLMRFRRQLGVVIERAAEGRQ